MKYFLLCLSLLVSLLFAEEYKVVKLRWESIEGAKSYVVQVSDSNTFENILYETKTKDTRIEFEYDPSYKFARFAGIDKNGIRGEFSDSVSIDTRLAIAKKGGNNLFFSISYVNWTSGAIDNFIKISNYSLLNNLLLTQILLPFSGGGFKYTYNGNVSNQLKGRSIELGGDFASKSGNWRNRFILRNVFARPENGYTLEQMGTNTNFESHSFDPLQMVFFKYNLKYLPLLNSSNFFLKGLGFQAGLNLQKENLNASMIYFSVNPPVVYDAGILPQKNKYYNQTNYLNIGIGFQYEFNKTHEFNFGLDYLVGKSNGENQYNYWITIPFTLPTSSKTSFLANVNGVLVNLYYTYNINQKHGIRFGFEDRTLNYTITESKTREKIGLSLPIDNLGSHPTLRDNLKSFSLEYFYKL